jgi:arginase family enzyme
MKSKQLDSSRSPRFAQPATFMRLPHQTDLTGVDVAILGVPFDSGTSYRSGARLGPREIRAQSSLIRPYSYFLKISPFEQLTIVDAGDVDAQSVGLEGAYAAIDAGVRGIVDAGAMPLVACSSCSA